MDPIDVGSVLHSLSRCAPDDVPDAIARAAALTGAFDLTIYLVDFAQSMLVPVPDIRPHVDVPVAVPVDGSPEGEAYLGRRMVTSSPDGATRICVPVIEGSECTGVLAFSQTGPLVDGTSRRCEELGMLAGAAIVVAARSTDLFNVVRRRKAMSLPASIQWGLLPPLQVAAPGVSSNGVLEPAYDVGGDCFDHAVNGQTADVVIMDAMGHGLGSSMLSSLAIETYRHDRREGQPLAVTYGHVDEVLGETFGDDRFVTGQMAKLDLQAGRLAWTNAGHPLPLLVRGERVLAQLECRPSLPWGLGGELVEVAESALRPGDSVVFYTDGVFEGRDSSGTEFGMDRFIDAIERASSERPPAGVSLRSAVRHIVEFQGEALRDDATVVWLTWELSA